MAARRSATDVDVSNVSATLLAADNHHRTALVIQNLGPNAIFLGPSDVTTATGLSVAASGGAYTEDINPSLAIYAIAATAAQSGTANTRVLESFDG